MEHQFDINIAKLYGIEEAIIIKNLCFWIKKNKANNKNLKDGMYWTYNSISSFKELFPYMSESKIKRVLKNLEDISIIKSNNYNDSKYDRTKWYSVTDKSIVQLYDIHLVILDNGKDQNSQPIPDSKPYSKPDTNHNRQIEVAICNKNNDKDNKQNNNKTSNNTSSNNISIDERINRWIETAKNNINVENGHDYIFVNFINYWTGYNDGDSKFLAEKKKSFVFKSRYSTFVENDNKSKQNNGPLNFKHQQLKNSTLEFFSEEINNNDDTGFLRDENNKSIDWYR